MVSLANFRKIRVARSKKYKTTQGDVAAQCPATLLVCMHVEQNNVAMKLPNNIFRMKSEPSSSNIFRNILFFVNICYVMLKEESV